MRISGLLVVLLCGLVSICGASDLLRQNSTQAAVNSFNSDWVHTAGIVRPNAVNVAESDRGDRDQARSDSARDGGVTCYTIQNFLVKRASPHSDVTEWAGHSTCVPASRYSVKTVEEPGKAPSR